MKRAFLYVDGLNLYHRAARRYNLKWVNVCELARQLIADDNEIVKTKYFTALVGRSSGPKKPARQRIYLRALATVPNLEVVKGRFRYREDYRLRAEAPHDMVKVRMPEEKGSDVNLAVHMVDDAHRDLYDVALVISNDSDLIGALRIVRRQGKIVGVLCPSDQIADPLKKAANFHRTICREHLRQAEFPAHLTGPPRPLPPSPQVEIDRPPSPGSRRPVATASPPPPRDSPSPHSPPLLRLRLLTARQASNAL